MDDSERQMIKDNLKELVSKTKNFKGLLKELMERKMFNKFMENELRQRDRDKMLYLYDYVTTRGPQAFDKLKNALIATGNIEAASFLKGARPFRTAMNGESVERENEVEERENGETEEQRQARELTVTKSQQRMDVDREQAYKMGSSPKGHALILNIRSYVNNIETERLGSEHDVQALKTVLSQLGYDTYAVPNEQLNEDEFLEEIKIFSKKKEHHKCDSAVVVMMTHGSTDLPSSLIKLKSYNGKDISLNAVIEMFSAERCPGLANKPKLFFIQVCRGNMPHSKVSLGNGSTETAIQTDSISMAAPTLVRNHADMLIGHATIQGYVSYRHPSTGSWFIQELCKALARLAHNTDLSTIMEQVHRRMRRANDPDIISGTEKIGFNKKFYFNPGFYDETPLLTMNES